MSDRPKILIVDDEPFSVDVLEQQLEEQDYRTCAAYDGVEALEKLESEEPDLVLMDWQMPEMSGIQALEKMRSIPKWQSVPVIMLTGRATTEDTVAGLNAGADDYFTKPVDEAVLWARVGAQLRIANLQRENVALREEIKSRSKPTGVIGKSPSMQRVNALVEKVIDSDATVLLSGETGTGKGVIAQGIHQQGPRKDKNFVNVNCGAMAETLLESELFGHKKGAFTGATADRAGLFESADGGTLFLDEIGETTNKLQVGLLRAIQEGEIRRVGEDENRRVDVRVIAATNRDLSEEVKEKRFREDLYYRLSVFPIPLPPLRERRDDIPDLAHHALSLARAPDKERPDGFTTAAMDALCAHDWPGNIRALENEIARAVLLCGDEERIDVSYLSEDLQAASAPAASVPRSGKLKDVLAQVEREMMVEALVRNDGNRTRAAQELGVSRWGLVQKIKAFGIEG